MTAGRGGRVRVDYQDAKEVNSLVSQDDWAPSRSFRQQHVRLHDLMSELRVPHAYKDGPQRKHDWHSGWVSEAVELLMAKEM